MNVDWDTTTFRDSLKMKNLLERSRKAITTIPTITKTFTIDITLPKSKDQTTFKISLKTEQKGFTENIVPRFVFLTLKFAEPFWQMSTP